jgi:hypothetical protein
LHGVRADAADVQRIDRRDLHRLHWSGVDAGHDDAVADAVESKLLARLQDDLAPVSEEQDALVALNAVPDDGGCDLGFAGPGGGDEQHLAAFRERLLDPIDRVELVGAQIDHRSPSRLRRACISANH